MRKIAEDDGMSHQIPQWLTDYAVRCRSLLGMDNWTITLRYTDNMDASDDYGVVAGACDANPRYRYALIKVNRRVHESLNDASRETVMHEMLEALISELLMNTNRIIDLVPEDLQDHAVGLLDDAKERFITHLASALTLSFDTTPQS